jgi:hypothetical protein
VTTQTEAPWDFQRPETEPIIATPSYHETTVTVDGRKLFQGDGMMWQLLRKIRLAMGMVPDRGPEDFAETNYQRGVRDGVRNAGSPNVGGVNGGSKILTALVALNTALLIGLGSWLLVTVSRHDRELAVVNCLQGITCSKGVASVRP